MTSNEPVAGASADRERGTEAPAEAVDPGGAEIEDEADPAAGRDEAPDVDPDAPGAALVDPDLEQAEPNEPG